MRDYYTPTGSEIKHRRLRANISQSESADLVCVSENTWSRWEQGRHAMPSGLWKLFNNYISEGSFRVPSKSNEVNKTSLETLAEDFDSKDLTM